MVRSRYLTPEHLIRAIKAGDFYASSGVRLTEIVNDRTDGTLSVKIDAVKGEIYTTTFIGTRKQYDQSSKPRQTEENQRVTRRYSSDVGATLNTVSGNQATYRFQGDELYVRAVVTSSSGHDDPSFAGQKKQAWTQPVRP